MMGTRHSKRLLLTVFLSMTMALAIAYVSPNITRALTYGSGPYGGGVYGTGDSTSCPTPKSPDINGNTRVDVYDLSIMTTRWATAYAAADLDCSGSVDISDLSILLSNWQGSP